MRHQTRTKMELPTNKGFLGVHYWDYVVYGNAERNTTNVKCYFFLASYDFLLLIACNNRFKGKRSNNEKGALMYQTETAALIFTH